MHFIVRNPMVPAKVHLTTPSKWESAAWRHIQGSWKPLHGSYFAEGCSLEWHDFHLRKDFDWADSFHPGSLEICLNFSGNASFQNKALTTTLGANQMAIYATGKKEISARRLADSIHRFITVEVSPTFLARQFAATLNGLIPGVRKFAENSEAPLLQVEPLPSSLLNMRLSLLTPPVHSSALAVWYQSKILEILSQTLFRSDAPGELFCDRYKRVNHDRIAQVIYLLERDYENPPSLEMLAQEVECSPFHLSRLFTKQVGMSIPKFLRTKRIEQAAVLLREGRFNVSEVAATVGYASLSAFTKAFVEQIGCCPGLYPILKPETVLAEKKKKQFRA